MASYRGRVSAVSGWDGHRRGYKVNIALQVIFGILTSWSEAFVQTVAVTHTRTPVAYRICWTLKIRSGPGDCATKIEGEGTHETPTTTANAVDHFTVRLGWAFWHGIGQVRQCPELEDEKAYCYRCFAEPFRRASQHRCQSLVWYSSNPLQQQYMPYIESLSYALIPSSNQVENWSIGIWEYGNSVL